jgi:hypothetical protein
MALARRCSSAPGSLRDTGSVGAAIGRDNPGVPAAGTATATAFECRGWSSLPVACML